MKIVPPSSYTEAYNRAMNLESEQKTKKKKSSSSDSDDDASLEEESSDDEKGSKKVRALQKDMIRMMNEFKNMQKETKGNELWCTECKTEGHTRGSCPKNQLCKICQIMGHSTKECPFNMKTRGHQQVLRTQEASASGGSGNTSNDGATSGGYINNRRGQNNNNNGGRSQIQYDANGCPMVQCRACNL